ncbi:MAG: molybdate ABC transporter permease subunit [Gemmatimonadales bacterium]|nr:MAG: molybdate ABC transporter permease subunit [Gemmatimonadales bacterium]
MSSPLPLSLQVAFIATLLALVTGLPLAWLLARRSFPGRDLLSVVVLLPMVLPPTVLGYYLLLVVGREGMVGRMWEMAGLGRIVFTPTAAVLAAFVAALPFLVRAAQGGFEQVDPTYEEAARTLGRGEFSIFATVTVPLAWRGILAGVALGFARAIGEFGATLMVAGNIPGRTQTASIAIYDAVQGDRLEEAHLLALLLSFMAGGVLLLLTRVGRGGRW